MLTREAPDRFRVDFGRVPRERGWRQLIRVGSGRDAVVVDAFAIGQAVVQALGACPFRNAAGAPQVWNEYRVFLSRVDHDRLRPVEASLQQDLGPMLYQELLRVQATTVGALTVRLLIDDADEVEPGSAMLHARHVPDAQAAPAAPGEMTVRLDKVAVPAATPTTTQRLGGALVRSPGGDLPLTDGVRYVLGRAHPEAAPDHLPLPGAPSRVNRRQLSLRLDGDHVEVGREPGETNPVAVNGVALAPGQTTREKLPVEVVLSGGALTLQVRPC